jgi:16S rRNA (cytosine1402-N4)-methyltransferase
MSAYHIPVLLKESIEGLNISPDGVYVDVTYGGGGHSVEILNRLNKGKLFAFDQDDAAAKNLPDNKKFFFIQGNFRYIRNYLKYYGVERINGLLADLGVSSHHFDAPERGFTYRQDAELDMRMNRNAKLTAAMVINEYDTGRLSEIFYTYGEISQARKIAAAISTERNIKRIETVSQLISAIAHIIPRHLENQFLSKLFQSIRIEVNQELKSLEDLLGATMELLHPQGRLVVISYHSLEDRIVKNFMRWGNIKEQPLKDVFGHSYEPFRILTRKPVIATEGEIESNPRARSAKLRIAERN